MNYEKVNVRVPETLLNEMIMDYVSKHLSGGELECYYLLETGEEQGLSTLEMLHITKLSQDKYGQVFYNLEGDPSEHDFDELPYDVKMCVLEQIQEENQ